MVAVSSSDPALQSVSESDWNMLTKCAGKENTCGDELLELAVGVVMAEISGVSIELMDATGVGATGGVGP